MSLATRQNVGRLSLVDQVTRLANRKPRKNADYYCITLLGDENGAILRSVFSGFAGFTTTVPRRELREGSLIDPVLLKESFNQLREVSFIVNDRKDLHLFLLVGGHGIIEKKLARQYFSDLIKPTVVIQSFSKGFLRQDRLPKHKTNHAPSKIVRMRVLKRDNYRCKICGRAPADYVDIELHVHHVLPWGKGGITEEDNLISLCSTCHVGLEPHGDLALFDLMKIGLLQDVLGREVYMRGLKLYGEIVRKHYFSNR